MVDEAGRSQHPDVVKRVFDLLLRAVELYYRSRYRDFVLAELAWFNNGIMDWEEMAGKVKSGEVSAEERSTFYKVRFSGHMGSLREGESQVLAWLRDNPESESGVDQI